MAIPVNQVEPTILAFLEQLRNAQCAASQAGTEFELDEYIDFEMQVIAPEGLNLLPRVQLQENSGRQDSQTEAERLTTTEEGQQVTTTVTAPATSTTSDVTTSPAKTTRRTGRARTDVTTKQATPSTRTTLENPGVISMSKRQHSGGNGTTEDYTYNTVS